jgi:addiction module HigA family antidote
MARTKSFKTPVQSQVKADKKFAEALLRDGIDTTSLEMKNPARPGELIGETLAELGVSVTESAKRLGITRQQLHNVISGRSGVTAEMAVRLEKALGSTADTWLRMQMNYELAQIRQRARSIKVKRIKAA